MQDIDEISLAKIKHNNDAAKEMRRNLMFCKQSLVAKMNTLGKVY